jgi:hypothetical protein
MAKKPAPQAHLVRLRNVSTGEIVERYPVDARGMLLSGEFVAADAPPTDGEFHRQAAKAAAAAIERLDGQPLERGPDGLVSAAPGTTGDAIAPADPAAPNVTRAAPTLAEQLDGWTTKDLHRLAERLEIDPAEKSRAQLVDEFIATDLPGLVSAGVVSLEQLPELKITPEQFPNAAPAE